MPLPEPEPGLVIHYEYLWRHEHARGAEAGFKHRPCAIVLTHTRAEGRQEVVVAPITHAAPVAPAEGILLPPRVKQHLGLDDAPSWVIVTDLNVFNWPGVDLYPGAPGGAYAYGFLPPALFRQIIGRIRALRPASTRRTA